MNDATVIRLDNIPARVECMRSEPLPVYPAIRLTTTEDDICIDIELDGEWHRAVTHPRLAHIFKTFDLPSEFQSVNYDAVAIESSFDYFSIAAQINGAWLFLALDELRPGICRSIESAGIRHKHLEECRPAKRASPFSTGHDAMGIVRHMLGERAFRKITG